MNNEVLTFEDLLKIKDSIEGNIYIVYKRRKFF